MSEVLYEMRNVTHVLEAYDSLGLGHQPHIHEHRVLCTSFLGSLTLYEPLQTVK